MDFFTWNRDLFGIRPAGTEDQRPIRLTPAERAVACAIAAHVNGGTGQARIGHRRIAEAAQVTTSTVEAAIPALEAAGWIRVTRSTRAGTKASGTNAYELTSPVAGLRRIGDSEGRSEPRDIPLSSEIDALAELGISRDANPVPLVGVAAGEGCPGERGTLPRRAGHPTPESGAKLRLELRDELRGGEPQAGTSPARPRYVRPTRKSDPVPAGAAAPSAPTDPSRAASSGERPAEWCPRHPGGTDTPCRACGDARRAARAWDDHAEDRMRSEAAVRRATIATCAACDDAGWLLGPDGSVHDDNVRCDHSGVRSAAWTA